MGAILQEFQLRVPPAMRPISIGLDVLFKKRFVPI
jgi:hypothetical protein